MTQRRLGRRRRRGGADHGFTLVELLVSTALFAVVLALVGSATIVMSHALRKQQGQSDDLDASRKVIDLLDRQIRYANAVTQVGSTASLSYIAWQTGDTDQPQTCTEWKYDQVAGTLAYRTWAVPTVSGATVTPTSWVNEAVGVVADPGSPVFVTTAQAVAAASPSATVSPSVSASAGAIATSHAQLTVTFDTRHGTPSTTSKSQVTLTAINTGGVATATPVCNQVGTP